jgi:hypothetical protein
MIITAATLGREGSIRMAETVTLERDPLACKGRAVKMAAYQIRAVLMALERDHGVDVRNVAINCDSYVKFQTYIACSGQ